MDVARTGYIFHSNIKSDYDAYLLKLENLLNQSKGKAYKLEIKKDQFILLKNDKKHETLDRPFYYNTRVILNELREESNNLYNQITTTRLQPDNANKLKTLTHSYREIKATLMNILTYHNEINDIDRRNIEVKGLQSKKVEIKKHLDSLYEKILENNKNKQSVKAICSEFNKHNTIMSIDNQIRNLNNKENINYIIQTKEQPIETVEVTNVLDPAPKTDNQLGVMELNIEESLDEIAENLKENDVEELAFYENKPEIPTEDTLIPEVPEPVEQLKEKLLKITKKTKKKAVEDKDKDKDNKKIKMTKKKTDIYFNSKSKNKYHELSNFYGGVEGCYMKKRFGAKEVHDLIDQFETCSKDEFIEYLKKLQPSKKNWTPLKLKYWIKDDKPIRGILAKLVGKVSDKRRMGVLKEMLGIDDLKILPEASDDEKRIQMKECLMTKYKKPKYKELLLKTGIKPLHESPLRGGANLWTYRDDKGGDLLGKLLMEVRSELS